jgi:hypothetical protein
MTGDERPKPDMVPNFIIFIVVQITSAVAGRSLPMLALKTAKTGHLGSFFSIVVNSGSKICLNVAAFGTQRLTGV